MVEQALITKINEDMQRGYTFLMDNNSLSACTEWKKVWRSVVNVLKNGEYNSIEDFDKEFDGEQSIYNWASDYEMELANAAIDDIAFDKTRIAYCREYLKYISDKNENNSLNMKKAIAEAYFHMGDVVKGDNCFKRITKENATWAWGWIGWADAYSSETEYKNLEKSQDILELAMKVDGIEEVEEIKARLHDLYISAGKVVIDVNSESCADKTNGNDGVKKSVSVAELNNTIRKVKVGRNDQCPCGSGQKYKRCCGRK